MTMPLDIYNNLLTQLLIEKPFYGYFLSGITVQLHNLTDRLSFQLTPDFRLKLLLNNVLLKTETVDNQIKIIKASINGLIDGAVNNELSFLNRNKPLQNSERQIVFHQIRSLIKQASDRAEIIQKKPDYLNTITHSKIIQLLQENKINLAWQNQLRRFLNSGFKTKIKNTNHRPSKRYGTTPGLKIKRQSKLLVAIDTSGSMPEESFGAFFKIIFPIWKSGVRIHIVECDYEIRNTYDYKGYTPNQINGRGATNFNPPFEYAVQNYRPDALIYFTDGKGVKPKGDFSFRVLWLEINPDHL